MNFDELKLLSNQSGYPVCENVDHISDDMFSLADEKDAIKYKFIPIGYNDAEKTIDIAIYDPMDLNKIDTIRTLFVDLMVNFFLIRQETLERLIAEKYADKRLAEEWKKLVGEDEYSRYKGIK